MLEEIWEKYQKQIIITGVTVTVVFLIFSILIGAGQRDAKQMPEIGTENASEFSGKSGTVKATTSSENNFSRVNGPNSSSESGSTKSSRVMVDVKGAVKKPGVYEVKNGMRVVDVIEMAGGMNQSADRKNINMALQLSDQQVVYVPIKGEVKDSNITSNVSNANQQATTSTSSSGSSTVVNINSATKEELLTLNGVGDKKADQIINYRDEQGNFKSIEDLKNVQGIGDKIFEGLKDSVTV